MDTPARWRSGSSGWTASRSTPDRDPAGAAEGSRTGGQRVRQAEWQPARGVTKAVGDQGHQNKTKHVFCQFFLPSRSLKF